MSLIMKTLSCSMWFISLQLYDCKYVDMLLELTLMEHMY